MSTQPRRRKDDNGLDYAGARSYISSLALFIGIAAAIIGSWATVVGAMLVIFFCMAEW
jgi:hypothetical protein